MSARSIENRALRSIKSARSIPEPKLHLTSRREFEIFLAATVSACHIIHGAPPTEVQVRACVMGAQPDSIRCTLESLDDDNILQAVPHENSQTTYELTAPVALSEEFKREQRESAAPFIEPLQVRYEVTEDGE
jgi:hypothetical protein